MPAPTVPAVHADIEQTGFTASSAECPPMQHCEKDVPPSSPSLLTFRSHAMPSAMSSVQSLFIQISKKMTDMERSLIGVHKRVCDLASQLTRVESKLDGFISRQSAESQPVGLERTFHTTHLTEYIEVDLARILFLESKGSGHFACKLIEAIFPELFGPENLRFQYNWNDTDGKLELDLNRKETIRRTMQYFYPETQSLNAWSLLTVRINERLRRPVGKLQARSAQQNQELNTNGHQYTMDYLQDTDNVDPAGLTYLVM